MFGALLVGLTACAPAKSHRPGASGFYAGKTLSLLIGSHQDSEIDLACRAAAQALARALKDSPSVSVRNRAELDGRAALNDARAAPADGTTLFCGPVNLAGALIHPGQNEGSLASLTYLMSFSDTQIFYVRADTEPGIKTPGEIFDAENLVFGGASADSDKDLAARAALTLLGVPYAYQTGITSDEAGRTAVQQGLVNASLASLSDYRAVTGPKMADQGVVTAIFQSGLPDARGEMTHRDPGAPQTPTFLELYRARFAKDPPDGTDWQAVRILFGDQGFGRQTLALPPHAPSAAVAALRAAALEMMSDAAFQADLHTALGPSAQIYPGGRMQGAVADALAASPAVRERLRALVRSGIETSSR